MAAFKDVISNVPNLSKIHINFSPTIGNNPVSVCGNCRGGYEDYCTGNDPYAGYEGAFQCMASRAGDVAFVRDTTIAQATANSTYNPEVSNVITDGNVGSKKDCYKNRYIQNVDTPSSCDNRYEGYLIYVVHCQ